MDNKENKGGLYLCPTPIGNLEDITLRVLRTLREADLIAAEDTRNSIKLLNHFGIKTPMTSYHEFNKIEKGHYLVGEMAKGKKIALITDAGSPGISDPGEELVAMCYEAGLSVSALPGPSAVVSALTMSGLPTRRFCFEAFLPQEKKELERIMKQLQEETRTIVIYEAPHRLSRTMDMLANMFPKRKAAVIKELTKRHETRLCLSIEELSKYYRENEPKGEYVIVIEGKTFDEIEAEGKAKWDGMPIDEHLLIYLNKGMDKKSAMKQVALDRGIPKREVYDSLIKK